MLQVTEPYMLSYFLIVITLSISLVYLAVSFTARTERKRVSILLTCSLFAIISVSVSFGLIFHMFMTLAGVPAAIGIIITLFIPIYAITVLLREKLRIGAIVLIMMAVCYAGLVGDRSESFNYLELSKNYFLAAYKHYME